MTRATEAAPLLCPFDLTLDGIAAFVNCELADHPVYDALELQWFDDEVHGVGMLAFLAHRGGGRVDYYRAPGLTLDRTDYELGGGTGTWTETVFVADHLEVGPDGVVADVRFRDREGRLVEVQLDDREAGRRHGGELLAPVGASIDAPVSLALVVLRGFDLLRRTSSPPRIRIDGEDVRTGVLPAGALHHRHLIKAAAPLVVATLGRAGTRTLAAVDPAAPGRVRLAADGRGIAGVAAVDGSRTAELMLQPALPPLADLPDGGTSDGAWRVRVDGRPFTGGTWRATRRDQRVSLELEVTQPWRPAPGLPPLLRTVTRLVPTFRRWPTTYRWCADVRLGPIPLLTARWERTGGERGETYRRVTRSR